MVKTFLLFAVSAIGCFAQPYLNLDFETAARGLPWSWSTGDSVNFAYALDSSTFQAGAQSLRMRSLTRAAATSSGTVAQYFPVELVKGRHVKFTGWVKTAAAAGSAQLFLQVLGTAQTIAFDLAPVPATTGTADWTSYTIDRDVSNDAVSVAFGAFFTGIGSAWFDNFSIEIDGTPFVPGAPPDLSEPTQAQTDWINATAIPVATVDPTMPLDDLAGLKALVGNARIVALGEGTYGTSEFQKMKQRITQYLVTQLGFTVFALQGSMPDAGAMNDYVSNGGGSSKALLRNLLTWQYNTQETLDAVEWVKQYNGQSATSKVQFAGFDMRSPDTAVKIVEDFVGKADAAYLNETYRVYEEFKATTVSGFGYIFGTFPTSLAAGKHVKFTGYIKTNGITAGYAGLFWNVFGANNTILATDQMYGRGATGTSDWKQYTIEMDVPANALNVYFGALQPGNGQAWFDTFAVELDGVPYTDPRFDFDFEAAYPIGFSAMSSGGNNFQVRIDSSTAHTGQRSITSVYFGPAPVTADQLIQDTASVVTRLTASRDAYVQKGAAATDVDWAIQNARVVNQAAAYSKTGSVREGSLAANVEWILKQAGPNARIVIWTDNYEASRTPGSMGSYLAANHGPDYLPIAFAMNDGQYNAFDSTNLLAPQKASPAFAGSAEYVMHAAGLPQFILDWRQAAAADAGSGWLFGEKMFRNITSFVSDGFRVTPTLLRDYDAVVFVDRTKATLILPFY